MRREANDPLPFVIWLSELEELATRCADEPVEGEIRALWRTYRLFCLSPPSIRMFSEPILTEAEVELEVEKSGVLGTLERILGRHAKFEIDELREDGRWTAAVSLDEGATGSGEGSSPALAAIVAWANMLVKFDSA